MRRIISILLENEIAAGTNSLVFERKAYEKWEMIPKADNAYVYESSDGQVWKYIGKTQKDVAIIVRLPPCSMFRAAPKNRFGFSRACASTPPVKTLPDDGITVL